MAYYTAIQEYHKIEIDNIEVGFSETRDKREKRIKERVIELQKQVKALEG